MSMQVQPKASDRNIACKPMRVVSLWRAVVGLEVSRRWIGASGRQIEFCACERPISTLFNFVPFASLALLCHLQIFTSSSSSHHPRQRPYHSQHTTRFQRYTADHIRSLKPPVLRGRPVFSLPLCWRKERGRNTTSIPIIHDSSPHPLFHHFPSLPK